MRIAVIGATGRTGREVVEQALGHGSDVVAFARDPGRLDLHHPRLTEMPGDVRDLDSLRVAVAGCDAVICTFGSKPASQVDLYSVGIANVMQAMAEQQVPRLAVMSATGTFARDSRRLSIGYKLLLRTTLRGLYDDLERMEERVMAGGLTWTIVRPPGLTEGPRLGHYRIGIHGRPLSAGARMSRGDVAGFLIKCVTTGAWEFRAVSLAY